MHFYSDHHSGRHAFVCDRCSQKNQFRFDLRFVFFSCSAGSIKLESDKINILIEFFFHFFQLIIFVLVIGVYDTAKCQANADTLRLSDLSDSKGMKKLPEMGSGLDSGYYPSPYAMTKVNGSNIGQSSLNATCALSLANVALADATLSNKLLDRLTSDPNATHTHASPKKVCNQTSPLFCPTEPVYRSNDVSFVDCILFQMKEMEPLYATVKRTPRPPRSDLHVYQYPSKLSDSFFFSASLFF